MTEQLTEECIRKHAETMLTTAMQNLETDGDVMPVMLLLGCKAGNAIVGLQFENNEQKQRVYQAVQGFIALDKPKAIITVNDAWYKNTGKEDLDSVLRMERNGVCNEPDRKECIMVTVSQLDGEDYMIMQMYHREGDKVIWEEKLDKPGAFHNRLLPDTWKQQPDPAGVTNN